MRWKTALWRVPAYASVVVVVLVFAGVFRLGPWRLAFWMEITAGNAIIAKIERFRVEHGRLPDPDKHDEDTALGFELRTNYYPDYLPMSTEYEIVYDIGFDGPRIVYSSSTKGWRCEDPC
jgi:hypothetical protein